MNKLQSKYLNFDANGEESSFNDRYLNEDEMEFHSDLTELFERGLYYTNNKQVVEALKVLLVREQVKYQLIESQSIWKYKLELVLEEDQSGNE
ncbi:hypothetical protein D3C71_964120 [compost metagenome]